MEKLNLIDQINSELKEIDERLKLTFDVEDIYGQDFEEYGIEDIEETRHFSLLLKHSESHATVIQKHFYFDMKRSLLLERNAKEYLKRMDFTMEEIMKIEKIFMSKAK